MPTFSCPLTRSRGLGSHLPGGVVVGADVGAHRVGVHVAVDGHDLDPRPGGLVNGLGVVLVVDGGKDQGLGSGLHGVGHHLVLGFVVLLRLGTQNVQREVILCGRGLGPGKNGQPELGLGGLGHQGHGVLGGGDRAGGAGAQQAQGQSHPADAPFTLSHSLPP